MNKSRIIFLLALLPFWGVLTGQESPEKGLCGTEGGMNKWLVGYLNDPLAYPESNDTLYIPLQIHLVGDDNGNGFFATRNLLDAFCTLQQDYKSAGIQFHLLDINYIANSTYYNHNRQTGEEMMSTYKVEGALNCYIPNSPGTGLCGYSDYNLGVTMAKGCVSPTDHTWSHEIGHFLSLPHPFLGWEGENHDYNLAAPVQWGDDIVERTDGTFCAIAADGFCDTPPDYLNFRWPCDQDGKSIQEQTDPTGAKFFSDASLIMSYAYDNCVNRFSHEQGLAMVANLLSEKQDYFDQPYLPQESVVEQDLIPVSPADGELVAEYGNVYIEWEPVQHATHYELQVTNFEPFSYILKSYIVEGNSIVVTDLKADEEYWWRIRPYNSQDACTSVTGKSGFITGNLSSVRNPELAGGLTVFPNPVRSGRDMVVQVEATKGFPASLTLADVSGQTIRAENIQLSSGQNRFLQNLAEVPAGLYFLTLKSESAVFTQKIMVR